MWFPQEASALVQLEVLPTEKMQGEGARRKNPSLANKHPSERGWRARSRHGLH